MKKDLLKKGYIEAVHAVDEKNGNCQGDEGTVLIDFEVAGSDGDDGDCVICMS